MDLVGVAGPFTVGQRPTLNCKAFGGNPPPVVTWWKNGQLVDEKYHHLNSK